MSQNSQGTDPANVSPELAPQSSSGPFNPFPDGVREVKPFALFGGKEDPFGGKDFRATPDPEESLVPTVEEEEPPTDPKDSSAPESADSSQSTDTVTTDESSESSASQETTASAEKASGKPKASENGSPIF